MEDYFSHAYGDDWREIVKILEKIGEAMPHRYMARHDSADIKISKTYNPAYAPLLRRVPAIAEEAKPFLEAHKNMPMRAQTVAYKLFRYYMEYCTKISRCLVLQSLGALVEAREEFEKFLYDFGKHEVEIETYFDQYMMGFMYEMLIFKKIAKVPPKSESDNPFAAQQK
jgi:hypothetical protein